MELKKSKKEREILIKPILDELDYALQELVKGPIILFEEKYDRAWDTLLEAIRIDFLFKERNARARETIVEALRILSSLGGLNEFKDLMYGEIIGDHVVVSSGKVRPTVQLHS